MVSKKPIQNKMVFKVIILLLLVVVGEIFIVTYTLKELKADYGILNDLKHVKLLNQKLNNLFDNKTSYRSYDKIVEHLDLFNEIILNLEQYNVFDSKTDETEHLIQKFQLIKSKLPDYSDIIEQYKSINSITINSIRYLFDLHPEIQSYVYRIKNLNNKDQISFLLDEIIYSISKLNFSRSDNIPHIKYSMHELLKISKGDKNLLTNVKIMALHTDIIIKGVSRLTYLENENNKLKLGDSINDLYDLLLLSFQKKDQDYQFIIHFLHFSVLFLIILLLVVHHKESSSQKKITQLNNNLEDKLLDIEEINQQMSKLLHEFDMNVIASSTDLKGNITYASKAFSQVSGYSTQELLGANHNIVRHADMPKETYKELWDTIQDGKIWRGEIKNQKKHGEFYWVNVTITPEFDKNDNIIGFNAIRHNITAQKELEILTETLEHKVNERTKELREMVKSVELLSITDELTGLYNRRYYVQVIEREIKRSLRNKEFFCYMSIDLDHFKVFNDTYGHYRGDELLKLLAHTMKQSLNRPDDFIFRMGGEEFTIIYSVSEYSDGPKLANQIINNVEALHIEHKNNQPYNIVTVSAGLILNTQFDVDIIEESIYKQADSMLYHAKSLGRNCLRYKEYK